MKRTTSKDIILAVIIYQIYFQMYFHFSNNQKG